MGFKRLLNVYRLRRNLRLKPAVLKELQSKKLRAIVKHAYEQVPYIRKKLDSVNIKPSDIKTISDLSKLPVTTKSEIQNSPFKDIVTKNLDLNDCYKMKTSGSTGMPLSVFVDRKAFQTYEAVASRAFLENGLTFFDRMAVVSGPRPHLKKKYWFQYFGIMRRKHISIRSRPEDQLENLKTYKPDVLRGFPSALSTLAVLYNKRD
jgi:phenylacetate-CoA ligase